MRLTVRVAALVAGAMVFSQAAAAKEPLVLAPSTPWNLNYSDDNCELNRGFGEGKNLTILRLEKFVPGHGFVLVAMGKSMRTYGNRKTHDLARQYQSSDLIEELTVTFGPQETGYTTHFLRLEADSGMSGIMSAGHIMVVAPHRDEVDRDNQLNGLWFGQASPSPLQYAAIKYVQFEGLRKGTVRLQTGALDKAFEAMSACVDDYVRSWGLDPAEQRSLSKNASPITDTQKWLSSWDYPRWAGRIGAQATLQFRLMVDAEGKATDCKIMRLLGDDDFGKAACKALMENAELAPALDKDGNSVASFFVSSVTFQIG